jgi:hypothetical protein
MKRALLVIALLTTSLYAADDAVSRVCGKLQYAGVQKPNKLYVDSPKPVRQAKVFLFTSKSSFDSGADALTSGKTSRWGTFKLRQVPSGNYFLVVKTAEGKEFSASVLVNTRMEMLCGDQGYEVAENGKLTHWITITVD